MTEIQMERPLKEDFGSDEEYNNAIERWRIRRYAVTGTHHGAIIYALSEGQARRIFHAHYNGESIISCNPTLAT